MFYKMTSTLLIVLLCTHLPIKAQSKSEIKFKRQIFEWGLNQKIKLRLRSGEKLEGRITEVKPDSFALQFVSTSGQINSREIGYNDLDKLSKRRDPSQPPLFGSGMRTMLIIGAITLVMQYVFTATNND
jgi:hypothetical protein